MRHGDGVRTPEIVAGARDGRVMLAGIGDRLAVIGAVADERGAAALGREARALAERVDEGRFYVACIGQFKRGKSSLLDALLGERLLPIGVVPVTSVPTVVRFGEVRAARVRLGDTDWRAIEIVALEQYVSEERNPENRKGVTGVEVFVPHPMLADGLCLVDTPGVGSIFAGNTEAAHAFVPQVDAALVVIGADPPLAAEELALIERVARQVEDLIVVLNKADRVSEHELAEACAFAERALEQRLRRPVGPILLVSATERLAGAPPPRDWPALLALLDALAHRSAAGILRAAAERGTGRLTSALLALLDEQRDALLRPLDESEARLEALRATAREAEAAVADLAPLFAAEQARLTRALDARHRAFLERTARAAAAELHSRLAAAQHLAPDAGAAAPRGRALRRIAMAEAADIVRSRVVPWLADEQRFADEEYRRSIGRFAQLADEFLDRFTTMGLRAAATARFSERVAFGFGDDGTPLRFQFHSLLRVAENASPLVYLADLARTLTGRREPIVRDAERYLGEILEINTSRARYATEERAAEARRRLEQQIRVALVESVRAAADAIDRARQAHAEGTAQVAAELQRIAALESRLRA